MADFIDNFNFDPADNKETSVSYTVPDGMYAIMSVTLSVDAYGQVSSIGGVSNVVGSGETSNSNSIQMELRLKAGEIVTKVETSANATDNTTGQTTRVNGTSIAQVLVNGNVVGTVRCTASAYISDNSGDPRTVTVSGNADVDWHISEYIKQGA